MRGTHGIQRLPGTLKDSFHKQQMLFAGSKQPRSHDGKVRGFMALSNTSLNPPNARALCNPKAQPARGSAGLRGRLSKPKCQSSKQSAGVQD